MYIVDVGNRWVSVSPPPKVGTVSLVELSMHCMHVVQKLLIDTALWPDGQSTCSGGCGSVMCGTNPILELHSP